MIKFESKNQESRKKDFLVNLFSCHCFWFLHAIPLGYIKTQLSHDIKFGPDFSDSRKKDFLQMFLLRSCSTTLVSILYRKGVQTCHHIAFRRALNLNQKIKNTGRRIFWRLFFCLQFFFVLHTIPIGYD